MAIDPGTALLASTGAGILAGAFGGNSNPQGINYNMTRELSQRQKFDEQLYGQSKKWLQQDEWFKKRDRELAGVSDQKFKEKDAMRGRREATWNLENIYGNQIQTKANDARKAGLHPLFAMGSQGYAPPPAMISGGPPAGQPGRAPSNSSGIAGQSSRGNFLLDGLQAAAASLGMVARIQAQESLIDKQAQASREQVAGNNISNDTAGTAITSAVRPADVDRSVPLRRHKSEQSNRDYITPDGKVKQGVVPKGTPFEMLEKEFGEWANVHPDTLKRFFGFLQNTDYIPSGADLKAWFNDWRKTKSIKAPSIKK